MWVYTIAFHQGCVILNYIGTVSGMFVGAALNSRLLREGFDVSIKRGVLRVAGSISVHVAYDSREC